MLLYIRKIVQSENFLAAAIFGVSGIAFAAANIILARVQTVEAYAVFALVIAIFTLASGLGQFGADGVVNRHKLKPDFRTFFRLFWTSTITAIVASLAVTGIYDVAAPIAALLGVAVVCQSIIFFCAAWYRSHQNFRTALLTFNSSNYIILAVAIAAAFFGWQGALIPLALITVLVLANAIRSVISVTSTYRTVTSDYVYSWREAAAYISITGSGALLVQLERLVTPMLLTLDDLATLGVLLAIVGPPFRLLQMTLGYVLLPKLRNARDSLEKTSLIMREIMIALALLAPCWILTWYFVPVLDGLFFDDKYPLAEDLILAVIVAGTAKSLSGLGMASVAGLVSASRLEIMGLISWGAVFVSVVGAYYGSGFGLAGVVYGVSLGWFMRVIAAATMVAMHMNSDEEIAPVDEQPDTMMP